MVVIFDIQPYEVAYKGLAGVFYVLSMIPAEKGRLKLHLRPHAKNKDQRLRFITVDRSELDQALHLIDERELLRR